LIVHAGFDLVRERQDPLLDRAIVERIINLHEIGLLASKDRFDRSEVAVKGRRNADIAAYALAFPILELREGLMRCAHVMELKQLDLRGLEPS
jgi:hypothetical protein